LRCWQPARPPFGAKQDSRDDTIVLADNGATIAGRVVDDRKRALDVFNVVDLPPTRA
jgi:hypothetical protein